MSINEIEASLEARLITAINQKLFLIEQITFILKSLIDSITFAKLNTFHPSIISIDHFLKELKVIEQNLKSEKLPKLPTHQNMPYYEKIINVKAYVKGHLLTFILEIPLVRKSSFIFYKLTSSPIKYSGNIFHYIIPSNRYLLLDNNVFVSPTPKCIEITTNDYLCDTSQLINVNENSPCEIQLLTMTNNYKNCEQHYQNLTTTWTEKIANSQWIIISPIKQRIEKICNAETEIDILEGSYHVYIPTECALHMDNTSLASHQSIRYQEVKIPKLNFTISEATIARIPLIHANLTTTAFNVKTNNQLIKLQKQISYIEDHSATTRTWTAMSYLPWAIIASYIIYQLWSAKLRRQKLVSENQTTASSPQSWIP